jgi:hypothetical protein
MSVDLNLFCDPERRNLSVPFSLNGHTYASNGHIIVRVPRRPDIPENKEAPNAEKLLPWDFSRVKFWPLPEPKLYPINAVGVLVQDISTNARIVVVNANTARESASSRHVSGSARLFTSARTSNGYRRSQAWRLESQCASIHIRYRFDSRTARDCLCRAEGDRAHVEALRGQMTGGI